MKAIMLMFDSLNRHMLPPYGCSWVHAPNFRRLAEKSVVFERAYAGSLPCMPARRELHTGRLNFLHRTWGPLEPFDDSMPEILKRNGVYAHLTTDHYHYWEDGGATYHNRYSSYQFWRGQEADLWRGVVNPPDVGEHAGNRSPQDMANRAFMNREELHPQPKTVSASLEFISTNHNDDNWFLHIETFDPHEPYFVPDHFRTLYPHEYEGPPFDWPRYGPVTETPEQIEHCRRQYAALVTMCDKYLGIVLDAMDDYELWDDTMLIVNTDHGFLLGEHDQWAKRVQPFFEEVSHVPLFIWDPRSGCQGERRKALVQTIDLAPTLLDYFGVPVPKDMSGVPLREAVATDEPVREGALFGIHGGHMNCTDGRYVYMRAPATAANEPLHQYTLMPIQKDFFSKEQIDAAEFVEPFSFTKDYRMMKVPGGSFIGNALDYGTLLFDVATDPKQETPLDDPEQEQRMAALMARLMLEHDAPADQFERMGLTPAHLENAHSL